MNAEFEALTAVVADPLLLPFETCLELSECGEFSDCSVPLRRMIPLFARSSPPLLLFGCLVSAEWIPDRSPGCGEGSVLLDRFTPLCPVISWADDGAADGWYGFKSAEIWCKLLAVAGTVGGVSGVDGEGCECESWSARLTAFQETRETLRGLPGQEGRRRSFGYPFKQ